MAQFNGLTFDFTNDSSLNYDVYIVEIGNPGGVQTESASGNISVISDSIPRRAERYIYGVQEDGVLSFSMTIASDMEKSRADIDRILGWLLQSKPSYLHIGQTDMEAYRYKGFFINPQLVSIGKTAFGLQVTFESTSPFAYTFPQTRTWDIIGSTTITFNNTSAELGYLRPILTITPDNGTQFFSIVNETDAMREFRMEFLPAVDGTEIITVNNDLQIIQSSLGNDFSRHRFQNFASNMKWFRLLRGQNVLQIVGNGKLEMRYVFGRRIGA